jgi:hypothetical protein
MSSSQQQKSEYKQLVSSTYPGLLPTEPSVSLEAIARGVR